MFLNFILCIPSHFTILKTLLLREADWAGYDDSCLVTIMTLVSAIKDGGGIKKKLLLSNNFLLWVPPIFLSIPVVLLWLLLYLVKTEKHTNFKSFAIPFYFLSILPPLPLFFLF